MKRVRLLGVLLLFFILAVSALANSQIEAKPLKNQITPSEKASFQITITNKESSLQRYTIYSLQSGQGWSVDPFPLKDKIIDIPAGASYTTTIVATPLEDFAPGIYHVQVTIESDQGERYTEQLKMYLSPEEPVNYLPSLKVTIDMDEELDPRESQAIKLFLENRNPLNIAGLKVRMQSDIPQFSKEVAVDVLPLEKKTIEFTVIPNPYHPPKEYTLFFVFEYKGQTVKVVEQRILIKEIMPVFSTSVNSEEIFWKRFVKITATNGGNVKNTQEVKYPVSWLGALVAQSEGIIKKIDGQRNIIWEVTLSPGESQSLSAIIHYRLLLYLLGITLFLLLFYSWIRSPITISKSATATQDDPETLSKIKVTLEVRNRSAKMLKDVIISDIVPGIANVEQNLDLGTLKPQEVKHTKRGTKVVWSLQEIDAHEHRLITYKVQAKLSILGSIRLPRAVAEFRKAGTKRKAYSNSFRLGA